MSTTIIGQIDKILFEADGFFIAVLKTGEKISGTYLESEISTLKDSAITLSGFWEEHKKYGKTFKFEHLKVNQNLLFFFLTSSSSSAKSFASRFLILFAMLKNSLSI